MMIPNLIRQRGIALPVMLLIMVTMLATSIFLIKSINSTTLLAGNLAYESALGRQADLGLVTGFDWLSKTAIGNKNTFNNHVADQGYIANFNTDLDPSKAAFWSGSRTVTDAATKTSVEYVIHRLCKGIGSYSTGNPCVLTTNPTVAGATTAIGTSLGTNSVNFGSAPQLHYVITSRMSGPRGGHVVNQLVVMIGA